MQVRQFDLLRMFAGNGKMHDSAEPMSHMVVSVAGSHAADSALYNSGELLGEPDCRQGMSRQAFNLAVIWPEPQASPSNSSLDHGAVPLLWWRLRCTGSRIAAVRSNIRQSSTSKLAEGERIQLLELLGAGNVSMHCIAAPDANRSDGSSHVAIFPSHILPAAGNLMPTALAF